VACKPSAALPEAYRSLTAFSMPAAQQCLMWWPCQLGFTEFQLEHFSLYSVPAAGASGGCAKVRCGKGVAKVGSGDTRAAT